MLAVVWPPASAGASSSGALRGSPTPAARKLAALRQCALGDQGVRLRSQAAGVGHREELKCAQSSSGRASELAKRIDI